MDTTIRTGWMAAVALAAAGLALPALADGSEKSRDRDDDRVAMSEAPRAFYETPRGYGQRWHRDNAYREGFREGYREGYRQAWREGYQQAWREASRRQRHDYWRNGSYQPSAWRDGDWIYYRDNGTVVRVRAR